MCGRGFATWAHCDKTTGRVASRRTREEQLMSCAVGAWLDSVFFVGLVTWNASGWSESLKDANRGAIRSCETEENSSIQKNRADC